MTKKSGLDDLKKWALQSGFPLENDVYAILREVTAPSVVLEKDIPFGSTDDGGRRQLRSIDFRGVVQRVLQIYPHDRQSDQLASLNFVLDAKYTLDEDKNRFWFIPSGKQVQEFSFPHLIPQARHNDLYNVSRLSFRKDLVEFALCTKDFRLASVGRKVSELKDGRESLSAYQMQVLEAVAHFVGIDFWSLAKADRNSGNLHFAPQIYIPIVVTNAPLYILKESITISEVERAVDATDICDSIDCLLVEAPNIHHFKEALRKLSTNIREQGDHYLKWKYTELNLSPVIFCKASTLKPLLAKFIDRFNSLPGKVS